MSPIKVGRNWDSNPRRLSLRAFEQTTQDLGALARVRNETLRAITLPDDFHEMNAEEISRFYNRADFSLQGNAWLMFMGEEPIAAAVLYPAAIFQNRPPANFDLYVVPQFSRHGLGSRLLDHLEQAAIERDYPALEATIAQEDSLSTSFLGKRGFKVVGASLHMVREKVDDAGAAAAELPPGYTIRSLAELREPPELYRDTANRLGSYDSNYSLIRPEEMEQLAASDHWEPAGVLFLFDPRERIVGVIRASGTLSGKGRLHEIRLEPQSRGMGLSSALVAVALQYLARAGCTRAELDTVGENTRAYNLALKSGFEVARRWLHFMKRLD